MSSGRLSLFSNLHFLEIFFFSKIISEFRVREKKIGSNVDTLRKGVINREES